MIFKIVQYQAFCDKCNESATVTAQGDGIQEYMDSPNIHTKQEFLQVLRSYNWHVPNDNYTLCPTCNINKVKPNWR